MAAAKEKAAKAAGGSSSSSTKKPFTLKDHERTRLETKGVHAFVDTHDEDAPLAPGSRSSTFAFNDEQRDLRQNLLKAMKEGGDSDGGGQGGGSDADAGADDEEEGGGFFQLRSKTTQEAADEEQDYSAWLENSTAVANEQAQEEMEPLRRLWTSKDLSHNDKFLRDYITGRQWRSDESVPTYSQITGSSGVGRTFAAPGSSGAPGSHPMEHQAISMEDLDAEVEAMEAHEKKVNFRYEEEGATEIQTYPRTIGDSVRRKDTKRSAARDRAKVRKEDEKQQKQEEIARLKKIKQTEIIAKLAEIKVRPVPCESICWFSPRICSRTLMGEGYSRGGTLLPSSYADVRSSDDVVAC